MTWWDLKTKALHIQFGMCLTKLQKIICHYKMSFFEIAKCIFPSQRKWWVIDPFQGLKAKVSILIQLVSKCRWDFQVKPAAMIWISENLWTKVISWKCYEILGIGITLYFKQTHGTQYSIYSPKVSMPVVWWQKHFIQHLIRKKNDHYWEQLWNKFNHLQSNGKKH